MLLRNLTRHLLLLSGPGDVDVIQAPRQTNYISENELLQFCQGAPSFLNCQIKLGGRPENGLIDVKEPGL